MAAWSKVSVVNPDIVPRTAIVAKRVGINHRKSL
jgi:hypothetical protein